MPGSSWILVLSSRSAKWFTLQDMMDLVLGSGEGFLGDTPWIRRLLISTFPLSPPPLDLLPPRCQTSPQIPSTAGSHHLLRKSGVAETSLMMSDYGGLHCFIDKQSYFKMYFETVCIQIMHCLSCILPQHSAEHC